MNGNQQLRFCIGTKPCDVKIEGADKLLRNLTGGLDGVYAVWSCENGRPLYKRQQSPPGRECPLPIYHSTTLILHCCPCSLGMLRTKVRKILERA